MRPTGQGEYLTEAEVERLIEAARKRGRNCNEGCLRNLTSVSAWAASGELCQLRWSEIDLRHGRLHVNRARAE